MPDRSKNILLGLFVLTACVTVMWILFTLKPRVGDGKQSLDALFSNINNISVGTQVTYAGRPVGEVVAIDPVEDPLHAPVDTAGRRYVYLVRMRIDSHVHLFTTDEVTVATSGLMGDRSVAIIPRQPQEGEVAEPLNGQILLANSMDALDTAVQQVGELATSLGTTMGRLGSFLEKNEAEFHRALQGFADAMTGVKEAIATMEEGKLFQHLPQAAEHVRSIAAALDDPPALRAIVQHVETLTASLSTVSRRLEAGEGSLGALLTRDDLYDDFSHLVKQAEEVMDSINRYGVLFHNDRRWQRQQKARGDAPCISAGDRGR